MPPEIEPPEVQDGLLAILEQNRPQILRMLTARLQNVDDAQDILQDLWLKVSRLTPGDSGPIANPSSYLFKMALNLSNDLVRARHRRELRHANWSQMMYGEDEAEAADCSANPETQAADKQQLQILAADIAALPARAAEVLRLHRLEDNSQTQVAKKLGISVSAVEKHMANAMRHLLTKKKEREQA